MSLIFFVISCEIFKSLFMKKTNLIFYSIKNGRINVSKAIGTLLLLFYTTAAFPQFWTSHFGDNTTHKTIDKLSGGICSGGLLFYGESLDESSGISDIYTASFNLDGEQTGSRIYQIFEQNSQTHLSVEYKDHLDVPADTSVTNWEYGGRIILGRILDVGYRGAPVLLSYNSIGFEVGKIFQCDSAANSDFVTIIGGKNSISEVYIGGSIDLSGSLRKLPAFIETNIHLGFSSESRLYFNVNSNDIDGHIDEVFTHDNTSIYQKIPSLFSMLDLVTSDFYYGYISNLFTTSPVVRYIDFTTVESNFGDILTINLGAFHKIHEHKFKLLINFSTVNYPGISLVVDVDFLSLTATNEYIFLSPFPVEGKDLKVRNSSETFVLFEINDGQEKAWIAKLDNTNNLIAQSGLSVSTKYIPESLLLINNVSKPANGIIAGGNSEGNSFLSDVTLIKSYFNFETPCNMEGSGLEVFDIDLQVYSEPSYYFYDMLCNDSDVDVNYSQSDYIQSCYEECMPNGSNLRPAKTETKKGSKFSETEFFSIVPNPTQGKLSLNNKKKEFVKTIEVRSLNGRVLKTYNVESKSENYQIDLSDLPKSMYIIQVITNKTSYSYKAIHN